MTIKKIKEKINRLERVLEKIESSERHQHCFNSLYKTLLKEYELEGGSSGNGNYNDNLRQTINKQASSFIRVDEKYKNPKKKRTDYDEFIRHFRQDVNEEILWLRSQTESDSFTEE